MDKEKALEKLDAIRKEWQEMADNFADLYENGCTLEGMSAIQNAYNEHDGNQAYPMCDFDEFFGDQKVSDVIWGLADGFRINDDYFWFDNLNNICSGSLEESVESLPKPDAQWLWENRDKVRELSNDYNDYMIDMDSLECDFQEVIDEMDNAGIDTKDIPYIDE